MKNTKKTILVLLASSIIALSGCSGNVNKNETPQNDISINTYKAQIEFYMQTVNSLQNELLEEKEANYIAECEYRLKIAKLEENVATLSAQIKAIKVNGGDGSTSKPSSSGSSYFYPTEKENTANPNLFFGEENGNGAFDALNSISSDYIYNVENNAVTITGYKGIDKDLIIPQSIEGKTVVAIAESAFSEHNIETVTLPEGILSIDWFAFKGCRNLREITLPSTLTYIGYGAFDFCSKGLTIICDDNSYAESYAISWGFQYEIK